MATGVEELVDMLFAMIDEAKSVPLSSEKCIIERDRALDLLDDIKAQFPMEFGEAKKLLAARADYIASAKREADLIRKQAEDRAKQLLDEDELMAQARRDAQGGRGAQPGAAPGGQRVLRGRSAPDGRGGERGPRGDQALPGPIPGRRRCGGRGCGGAGPRGL